MLLVKVEETDWMQVVLGYYRWVLVSNSFFPLPRHKNSTRKCLYEGCETKSVLWLSSTIHSLYCNYGLLLTFKSLLPDWDIYRNKTFWRHDFWHWHLFDTTSSGGPYKHQDPPLHSQSIAVCGFKCSLWTHSHWIHCPGFCVVLFLALNSNTRFSRTFSELRHKKRMFTYGICHPREQISQCVWYTTRKGIFKHLGTKIFCGALEQSKKALAASSLRVYIPCAVNLDWGTELVFWRKTNSKPLPDLKGVY